MRNMDRIRKNHFHLRGAICGLCFAVGASGASFIWGVPLLALMAWSLYRLDKLEKGDCHRRDPVV